MKEVTKMFKNKKADFVIDNWAEISALGLLVIGLIISLLVDSAVVSYAVIFLCGGIIGRLYCMRKNRLHAPFYIIVIGFLLGYIIGAYINKRGYVIVILIFFAFGLYFGNLAVKKKLIR